MMEDEPIEETESENTIFPDASIDAESETDCNNTNNFLNFDLPIWCIGGCV